MKKIITIYCFVFFLISYLHGENFSFENEVFYSSMLYRFEFKEGKISLVYNGWADFSKTSENELIYSEPYRITRDGHFLLFDFKNIKDVIIYDNNKLLLYNYESTGEEESSRKYSLLTSPTPRELWKLHNITSSSYLVENISGQQVSYPPQNLQNGDIQSPWVEGEPGSGVGSIISVDERPGEGIPNLVFVNGFFHPTKRYLYEYNNRIKKFLFESTDDENPYDMIIELEDSPNFQTFWLPRITKSFNLTILEVYKGTKYDDTCLAGLYSDPSLERVKKN